MKEIDVFIENEIYNLMVRYLNNEITNYDLNGSMDKNNMVAEYEGGRI